MLSLRKNLLSMFLLFTFCTHSYLAKSALPEYENIYVNDYAQILDNDAEERIRNSLKELYQYRQIEMTVLTITSMGNYDSRGPIELFSTRLFNKWGIGDADRNDGVLILVSRNDRKMRIEIAAS